MSNPKNDIEDLIAKVKADVGLRPPGPVVMPFSAAEELYRQIVAVQTERDAALAALRLAAEEARALRLVLVPTQKLAIAMAAVDQYNALLLRLASMDGLTEYEKALRKVQKAVSDELHYACLVIRNYRNDIAARPDLVAEGFCQGEIYTDAHERLLEGPTCPPQ